MISEKKAWILAARPKTLPLAAIPVCIGSVLAYRMNGMFLRDQALFALLAALFIQIGTNLINDALDFKKGADTVSRKGSMRVTQAGLLSFQTVYLAGIFSFLLALVLGIPLILKGGIPIACLLTISALSGYLYTGGPFPLAYYGLGELFVFLFFGIASTVAVYFLQTGVLGIAPFIAGIQLGLLACVPIAINNLRDIQEDEQVNKRTLAVRFGAVFAKDLITACLLLPFFLNLYWFPVAVSAALLPFVVLPFALWLVCMLTITSPSSEYNHLLAKSVMLDLMFALLLGIGIIWS